ncbi:MAG: WbqC family protein [Candidatus Levybacteria bacterium]|nr:WbqC family protein [Candidatus Levybacteria bacterium]
MIKIANRKLYKRYTGIQPQYFPRLHYFARILNADVFLIRDDAQFVRKHKYPDGKTGKSYQAHTPIKQALNTHFFMVPTMHIGIFSLTKTVISYNESWTETHLKTLQTVYRKAPNFQKLYPEIEDLLNTSYKYLAELNIATILWGILHLLGEIKVTKDKLSIEFVNNKLKKQNAFRLKNIRNASQSKILVLNNKLTANEKIIALCKETGANEDYCGETGVAAYIDKKLFESNGIKITVQDWKCKEYAQLFYKQQGFIPNLSIIDLLMNVPQKEAAKIIAG